MLILPADQTLLNQHQVQIEIDTVDKCGVIIFKDHRYKVTLLIRSVGEEDADWESKDLETEQMKQTASKVAVILLKKELLQTQQATILDLQIHKPGITNLTNKQLIKHEDTDLTKNTRPDYDALMQYLADLDDQEIIEDDVEDIDANDTEEIDEEVEEKIEVKQETKLVPQTIIAASEPIKTEPKKKKKEKVQQLVGKFRNLKENTYHPERVVNAIPPSLLSKFFPNNLQPNPL